MIPATYFLRYKNWKQPEYPLIKSWVNKLYIQTTEHCTTKENNKLVLHETTHINLKNIAN